MGHIGLATRLEALSSLYSCIDTLVALGIVSSGATEKRKPVAITQTWHLDLACSLKTHTHGDLV